MEKINIFIASPSDVRAERKILEESIFKISDRFERLFGVSLNPIKWEKFAPIKSEEKEVFQHRIITGLERCHLFIGILYRRYGTRIDQYKGLSGTEVEFKYALDNIDKIKIMTYFREGPGVNPEEHSQLRAVNDLKERLRRDAGLPYQTYKNAREFRDRIHYDLMEAVLEIYTDWKRRINLSKYFIFGNDKNPQPSVMIGYPAIHKHSGSSAQGNYNWQSRLLPNVVYEDFKAIQKIETALSRIGIEDYSSVTIDHPKLNEELGNRIWLCLPRNKLAQKMLNDFKDRKWFSFENDKIGERCIVWYPKKNAGPIKVYSPLSKYLIIQRPVKPTVWNPEYGRIFARDFAVLSRFKCDNPISGSSRRPYYHYFIAGIRGLGTWGVGWFIDRKHGELARLVEEQCGNKNGGDVQILLQITYNNYRIKDVVDVSDCSQDYFEKEMKDEYIKEHVY